MSASTGAEAHELLCAYRASMEQAGMVARQPTISVARMFFARVEPGGWDGLSLAEQCAQPLKNRGSSAGSW